MSQNLTDLLGANATASGTTITINLNDFVDGSLNPLLADATTATDEQKIACLIHGIWLNAKPALDTNGNPIVDKTNGVVAQDSFQSKTFETREDETQIKHERIFALYSSDTTDFDPDNVV